MSTKPTMTRAQYEMIATVIRNARSRAANDPHATPRQKQGAVRALARMAEDFATELRTTNERFDRERFIAACDPDGGYRNKSRPTAQARRNAQATRERAHEAAVEQERRANIGDM
jgi:hypothetical protein